MFNNGLHCRVKYVLFENYVLFAINKSKSCLRHSVGGYPVLCGDNQVIRLSEPLTVPTCGCFCRDYGMTWLDGILTGVVCQTTWCCPWS